MALLSQSLTSRNYEVSAMPCTESETDRSPSEGVAETLLRETAGRGMSYGDLVSTVATITLNCRG